MAATGAAAFTATAPARAEPAPAATTAYAYEEAEPSATSNPVWWILAGIALLFLAAYLWRSFQAMQPSGLPAVANSVRYAVCPAGYAHRSLFTADYLATLDAGPIVNDTESGETE